MLVASRCRAVDPVRRNTEGTSPTNHINDTTPHPPSSAAKVEANRQNAQKSTGPNDTTNTRFNAVKHGLLAEGVTELDDHDRYHAISEGLRTQFNPVSCMETFLVERMTLAMLRVQRASRLEAEHITATLNPPTTQKVAGELDKFCAKSFGTVEVVDRGLPASLTAQTVASLDNFSRYETAHENRLYRAVNQLRQFQRDRQNGQPQTATPPPSTPVVASFGNPPAGDTAAP